MKKILLILFGFLILSVLINLFFYQKILNTWCFLVEKDSRNFTEESLDQIIDMVGNNNCSSKK